jgi:hypothetical protein
VKFEGKQQVLQLQTTKRCPQYLKMYPLFFLVGLATL